LLLLLLVYNGDGDVFPQFQKDGIMVAKAPVGKNRFMERCARELFEKFASKCEPLHDYFQTLVDVVG
jgi:hypothetical protein